VGVGVRAPPPTPTPPNPQPPIPNPQLVKNFQFHKIIKINHKIII